MTSTAAEAAKVAATDIIYLPDDPVLDLAIAHPRWPEVGAAIGLADLADECGWPDDQVVALRREAERQYAQLAALVRRKLLPRAGRRRAECERAGHAHGRRSRPRARRTRTTSGARKAPVDDEPAGPEQACTDETRQAGQRK